MWQEEEEGEEEEEGAEGEGDEKRDLDWVQPVRFVKNGCGQLCLTVYSVSVLQFLSLLDVFFVDWFTIYM